MNDRDPAAQEFQDVALVHLEAVYRFAYRLARDSSVAEDLVQETYLRAWRAFARFERGTNARAWLFGILYYVWSHERRRRGRDPVVADDAVLDADALQADPPTPDALSDEDVRAAFDRLSPPLREAVLLVDIEGFTYREAAALMSVPLGTVMSRLNRARRQLRAQLNQFVGPRGVLRTPGPAAGGRLLPMKKAAR